MNSFLHPELTSPPLAGRWLPVGAILRHELTSSFPLAAASRSDFLHPGLASSPLQGGHLEPMNFCLRPELTSLPLTGSWLPVGAIWGDGVILSTPSRAPSRLWPQDGVTCAHQTAYHPICGSGVLLHPLAHSPFCGPGWRYVRQGSTTFSAKMQCLVNYLLF